MVPSFTRIVRGFVSKLKLCYEELTVESFRTSENEKELRGTVNGHMVTERFSCYYTLCGAQCVTRQYINTVCYGVE